MSNVDVNSILSNPIFTPELKVQIAEVTEQQTITEQFVDKIVRGIYKHGMLRGAPGLGKSHAVQTALHSHGLIKNVDYILLKGHCSAYQFYQALYRYRHTGKFVIIDDCDLDSDYKSLSLIRAAVDPVTRNTVAWHSTNHIATIDSIPVPSFQFLGSIILCTNVFQGSGRKSLMSSAHDAVCSRLPIRDVDWTTPEKKFAQIYNMVINADYLNNVVDRRDLTIDEKIAMLAFIVDNINNFVELDLRLPQKIAANICDTQVSDWQSFCSNTMLRK